MQTQKLETEDFFTFVKQAEATFQRRKKGDLLSC